MLWKWWTAPQLEVLLEERINLKSTLHGARLIVKLIVNGVGKYKNFLISRWSEKFQNCFASTHLRAAK